MDENEMIQIAMQMILYAGDASNYIKEALDAIVDGNENLANSKMKEANTAIEEAHRYQTGVVQRDAAGERAQYSLLFTHAQDTLMTIMSEKRIAEKMIAMYDSLLKKIG